jgi:hypothetical protein
VKGVRCQQRSFQLHVSISRISSQPPAQSSTVGKHFHGYSGEAKINGFSDVFGPVREPELDATTNALLRGDQSQNDASYGIRKRAEMKRFDLERWR